MFTKRGFNADGQFCELGGELVDTGHTELRALAKELGVGIQPLNPTGGFLPDIYHFGGQVRSSRDFLDPVAGTGAFLPLAARIGADQDSLYTEDEDWTDAARALDRLSLKAYLDSLRPLTQGWAIDALDLAYTCEFGLPTAEQSALNLIDFIGVGADEEFAMYGESDEAFRIAGGSSSLTDALVQAIGTRARLNTGAALTGISQEADRFRLDLDTLDGLASDRFDHVILALPFTRLRGVTGLDNLGLPAAKLAAIRELGIGNNAKLMVGTTSRPWLDGNLPVGGAVYSDTGFQSVWETSRAQPGGRGILTNFMAGDTARVTEAAALARLQAGLAAVLPSTAASLDPQTRASFFWEKHPHTLGSYTCARPGQYTTHLDVAGTPELNGRLHFAGEHTSPLHIGYMNGGVESGERAAGEVLGTA